MFGLRTSRALGRPYLRALSAKKGAGSKAPRAWNPG